MVTTAPYGAWPSPIDARLVAAHDGHAEYLGVVGDELWWTEPRPAEGGRRALIRRRADGAESSVLPAPWNVRSRVVEYGGQPWAGAVSADGHPVVVFSDFADQRLYVHAPDSGGPPRPLTPLSSVGGGLRWVDPVVRMERGEVWCVLEEFTGRAPTDVRRLLAAVPLDGSAADDRGAIRELSDDRHRFVTGPRISPDGSRAAWIAWDHPRMPWDSTTVMVAEIDDDGRFSDARPVAGDLSPGTREDAGRASGARGRGADRRSGAGVEHHTPRRADESAATAVPPASAGFTASSDFTAPGASTASGVSTARAGAAPAGAPEVSVVQVEWAEDGALLFVSDISGWWELRRLEVDAPGDGTGRPLCLSREEEFGGPLWKIGQRWFLPLEGGLIAMVHGTGATALGILDPVTGELVDAAGPWTEWASSLAVHGSRVFGIAASPRSDYEIVELDTRTGRSRVLADRHSDAVDPAYYPEPQIRTFTGPDGREVHAHIYPPHSPDHTAPDGERPPYVVWAHGGPTSRAPLVLDLGIAYFTSRGIGVAEVNYGGSTGYGRAYRDRLRGQWGVVDVEDCAAVAEALADEGTADRSRLAIRGGSAGGWTTAASLTSTTLYACGTLSYPVLDLVGWATGETHDMESRYLDSLIGPLDAMPERYRERSPINHADRIMVPFLLLEGLDDVICPPAQCERFLAKVEDGDIPHAYLAFEGEGHGFRRAETIVRAMEAELSLYVQTFGIARADVPVLELSK